MKTKPIRMSSIILSLCEIVIGILLLINPVSFTVGIITFLGIVLTLAGVVSVVSYFKEKPEIAALEQSLTRGILEVLAGLFCIIKSHWFVATFPLFTVIYGVLTLVMGIAKVQWMVDMIRTKVKRWGWVAVDAVITILCALIILCNPFSTTAILWIFVAVSLIVEAVADIIIAFFTKGKE